MNLKTRTSETGPEALPGFRLQRFEVLNWGTFDGKIWTLDANRANALLTGDIGSGKSTLVDAITTLLVPAGRITYNKAAGADGRERSLPDYILGHFKREKDTEGRGKAVSLRTRENALSVILGRFVDNPGNVVTLAQLFWLKEGRNQADRFFLISSDPLTIENDILHKGSDVHGMKKRLKALPSVEIYDTYTGYSAEFRRRMALQSQQAIELFYQTVSMKSIGNLTEFVRSHMLEETPATDRVEELCRNFDNLNRAHEAVLRAKDQIEILTPITEECTLYFKTEENISGLREYRESLYSYMAEIHLKLLEQKITRLEDESRRIKRRKEKTTTEIAGLEGERERIRRDIEDNGGRRLTEIEEKISELAAESGRRKERSSRYSKLAEQIEIDFPADEKGFHENNLLVKDIISELESSQNSLSSDKTEYAFKIRNLDDKYRTVDKELTSLRQRPTNIPARSLEMRRRLCEAVGLEPEDIPFAGELIMVKEEESSWEGAIERLMHNFGLSLLVDDEYYKRVSDYVDRSDLKGRLVYFRVKDDKARQPVQDSTGLLISKIKVKPDTYFYNWLQNEIASRFDYACAETLDDFRHHPKALTKAGQIKSGGVRHEKDDRFNINDRSRYILGWENSQKIILLEKQLEGIKAEGDILLARLNGIENQLQIIAKKRDAARDINSYTEFSEIDWKSIALKIEEYTGEKNEIEKSADILKTLKEQLDRIEKDLREKKDLTETLLRDEGGINGDLKLSKEQQRKAEESLNSIEESRRLELFPGIDEMREKAISGKKITLQSIGNIQTEIREYIQRQMDNLNDQNKRRSNNISVKMQRYKEKYPVETSETDASIEAAGDYQKMLDDLINEDLPRHQERFNRLLRERTIQDIALFQNLLEKERLKIKSKIDEINNSLREIEYNRGSYITIIPDRSSDREIRDFQEDLRICMSDTLSGSDGDVYTEQKFFQVKELINRFQGRPNYTELDARWTAKVTDVRNWFEFSASERWIEDDTEREYYSDSSGKSGGQKEKLAYTILAAALAYQFSLEKSALFNPSFRFVMIDEAFGRGSDESARYALELFRKLELQMLIVTPLQKIHIIEDYVNSVHFVYQEDNRSLVGNMTIEEYREQKKERSKGLDDNS